MPKIVNKKEISIAEAKVLLSEIKEPSQFQIRTIEYANKFSKLDSTKAKELVETLIEKFEIERKDAIQVVNCMPGSVEELRAFFSSGRKRLILTDQLANMLELLDKYR
jgi:DNA-directed RNA polymerase subunit F